MPSDTLSGRCYCGKTLMHADGPPLTVAYCHCGDCRRWSGAPISAFAAMSPNTVRFTPDLHWKSSVAGVTRANCRDCGSPLAARFDYLPDQIYIPVGLFDHPDTLPPQHHSHFGSRLDWLHLTDDLPKSDASARVTLLSSGLSSGPTRGTDTP
ncbi:GFA family protein [uncultured Pelagimonas sp.]|uniref:GFA family protein n=1 Tax=uncultured Pelagimonas sp. TaxID=1618102 RepID=UPI002611FAA1|nr:GFA family protein [uncultured Pelagimonas sp.]